MHEVVDKIIEQDRLATQLEYHAGIAAGIFSAYHLANAQNPLPLIADMVMGHPVAFASMAVATIAYAAYQQPESDTGSLLAGQVTIN